MKPHHAPMQLIEAKIAIMRKGVVQYKEKLTGFYYMNLPPFG